MGGKGYSLILWRRSAFDFHKYKYKECTQHRNCISLGKGTHVDVPACKHTRGKHGVMNVIYLHMLGKTTEIFFSTIHQRVFLLSGEQVLNKMLELKPEFKMKCFKMHSKQQLQARAGPDSLLMLA